jgi:hypothetical protein
LVYVKKTHRNIQKGDVFYIPLDRDAIYLRNGAGAYFSREDDTVAIAQVADLAGGMLVALYKGTFLQKEVKEQDFSYLQKLQPSALYETNTNGLTRGWWPFIQNEQIAADMPYQAYYRADEVLINWARDYEIPYDSKLHSGVNFIHHGLSGSSGIITEIARGINGLSTEWELEYDRFTPREDAVVWKIFPERYSAPQVMNARQS